MDEQTPHIDRKKCTNCGVCDDVCPFDVFKYESDIIIVSNPHNCINCRACQLKCPTDAIWFKEKVLPPFSKIKEENILDKPVKETPTDENPFDSSEALVSDDDDDNYDGVEFLPDNASEPMTGPVEDEKNLSDKPEQKENEEQKPDNLENHSSFPKEPLGHKKPTEEPGSKRNDSEKKLEEDSLFEISEHNEDNPFNFSDEFGEDEDNPFEETNDTGDEEKKKSMRNVVKKILGV